MRDQRGGALARRTAWRGGVDRAASPGSPSRKPRARGGRDGRPLAKGLRRERGNARSGGLFGGRGSGSRRRAAGDREPKRLPDAGADRGTLAGKRVIGRGVTSAKGRAFR